MPRSYRLGLMAALGVVVLALGSFAVREREAPVVLDEAPLLAGVWAAPVERVETHVLQRGETLDRVLGRASIAGRELANLLLALREFKSPRQLRAGTEVTVRSWIRDGTPRAVELRLNADSTVRLDNGPHGWEGRVTVTPTVVDTVYVSGRIEAGRTVYQALMEDPSLNLPPSERAALVVELAEIYAYKLDFSHDIQPGDTYRLVYEREARPDGTARRRRVLIAELDNRGTLFSAIHFSPNGDDGGYYDTEGRSLRGLFRRYPVDYVRITSSFSWRRYHPVLGVHRAHLGTDFGAPTGTPVKATGDGTVVKAGWNGGYGNMIELRHPGGYTTRYAHLSRIASGIRPGAKVAQGQVIGYVGSTGLATGPHLHYELRKGGQPLNARTARLPGAPPIPKDKEAEFAAIRDERVSLLERVSVPGPRFAGSGAEPAAEASGAS